MYRLIAIDMDGTLLSRAHGLSARNRDAVNALVRAGRHVVIATGRPFQIVQHLCEGIIFASPQITNNGAVVYDPVADRPLSETFLPSRWVPEILRYLHGEGIPAVACGANEIFLDERISDPAVWVPQGMASRALREVNNGAAEGLVKIAGDSDPAHITAIRPLAEERFAGDLYVTQTAANLIEFLNPTVSKGAALAEIARTLSIPADEILVFGDSHNDIAMFRKAGLAIAMGNASDEVKEAAGHVTLTNEEDGVAVALEELGLIERQD